MSFKFDMFCYDEAFSRTLGWITELERQQLRHRKVAIGGCGGVGGVHLLTLTRLGIGAFHIADLDTFDLANFNRQAGASMSTLGLPKVHVMADMARDINPELQLQSFDQGIQSTNVDAFLEGVDLYVDALDFFAFDARSLIFAACAKKGIPAITAGPLGMGAALVNFLPGRMTFEEYFGFEGVDSSEKALRLMVGVAPAAAQRRYLQAPQHVDIGQRRVPSTPMAVNLCAAVAGCESLKILLRRGPLVAAPRAVQYDAYLMRQSVTWRPWGSRNPLTRLQVALARRIFKGQGQSLPSALADPAPSPPVVKKPVSTMEAILNLARWAPSGDNCQPWRFRPVAADRVEVQFLGKRAGDIYDAAGLGSLMGLGCLLETLRLAASQYQWSMQWTYHSAVQSAGGAVDVQFFANVDHPKDPLSDFVRWRTVDRRPYRRLALTADQETALQQAAGDEFTLHWLKSPVSRWQASVLNARVIDLVNRTPEGIAISRQALDFDNPLSPDRIPIEATGVSRTSAALIRWVLATPQRAQFVLGHLPGTTLGAQLEMALIPGWFCASHFLLQARAIGPQADRQGMAIRAGIAVQRLWLTATRLGLVVQPSYGNLSLFHHVQSNEQFSKAPIALQRAQRIAKGFSRLCQTHQAKPECVVFMGRIGLPTPEVLLARSTRLSLNELLLPTSPCAPVGL